MFGEKFLCEASFAPILVTSESLLPLPLTVIFLQEAALCRQLPMEAETLATVQAAVNPPALFSILLLFTTWQPQPTSRLTR